MEAEPDAHDPQATEIPTPPSHPPLWRRFGVWVTAGVVLYIIAGAILLAKVSDRLLADWFPTLDERARAAFLGPAANVVLFALGGTIALIGVGLSLSRHRQELEAAERDRQRLVDDRERERARRGEVNDQRRIDTERALRERFVTTVKLLTILRRSTGKQPFSLSVHSPTTGTPSESSTRFRCASRSSPATSARHAPTTCSFPSLRNNSTPFRPPGVDIAQRTTAQEIAVKRAGYTVIRSHLSGGAAPHWHDRFINLAHAHLDFRLDLAGAPISDGGRVDLAGATISGVASPAKYFLFIVFHPYLKNGTKVRPIQYVCG